MHGVTTGLRAYQRIRAAKSPRELEAEVYAIAAGRLRAAHQGGTEIDRVRARADARRLFSTLRILVVHPSSELPVDLRASIASVCACALREVERPDADLEFLAALCDDFQGGLLMRQETPGP